MIRRNRSCQPRDSRPFKIWHSNLLRFHGEDTGRLRTCPHTNKKGDPTMRTALSFLQPLQQVQPSKTLRSELVVSMSTHARVTALRCRDCAVHNPMAIERTMRHACADRAIALVFRHARAHHRLAGTARRGVRHRHGRGHATVCRLLLGRQAGADVATERVHLRHVDRVRAAHARRHILHAAFVAG